MTNPVQSAPPDGRELFDDYLSKNQGPDLVKGIKSLATSTADSLSRFEQILGQVRAADGAGAKQWTNQYETTKSTFTVRSVSQFDSRELARLP